MAGLRVESIVRRYGSVTAVDRISFSVQRGEFVSLLGASGSGKTTTLRMIAGLEPVDEGSIIIGDSIVNGPGTNVPTARRHIGMVFQSYAVWPHMTVSQNVAFPLQQQKVAADAQRARVSKILELVELGDLAERFPSQLSGGQQQRVALARALVAEPSLILFDEPLSNLDARLRESMRGLIRTLHRRLELTSIYVTHDQAEAMALSDRILILDRGRVVQEGSPRALYQAPASVFVAEFLGSANTFAITSWDATRNMARIAGGLDIIASRVAGVADAAPRSLIIRPHGVLLRPLGTDSANTFKARVKQSTYLGDRVRYQLSISEQLELVAEVVAAAELPEEGAEVAVTLQPDQCLAL